MSASFSVELIFGWRLFRYNDGCDHVRPLLPQGMFFYCSRNMHYTLKIDGLFEDELGLEEMNTAYERLSKTDQFQKVAEFLKIKGGPSVFLETELD